MKAGSIVECIDERWDPDKNNPTKTFPMPHKGENYTVSEVMNLPGHPQNPYISLHEFPAIDSNGGFCWASRSFRELLPPEDITEKITEWQKSPKVQTV